MESGPVCKGRANFGGYGVSFAHVVTASQLGNGLIKASVMGRLMQGAEGSQSRWRPAWVRCSNRGAVMVDVTLQSDQMKIEQR